MCSDSLIPNSIDMTELLTLVWVLSSHGSRHGLVLEDTDLAIAFIAGGPHTRWFLGSARI